MHPMNASDYINDIIQLAEPGGIGSNIDHVAHKSFEFGEHGISFNGNNVQAYDESIKSVSYTHLTLPTKRIV